MNKSMKTSVNEIVAIAAISISLIILLSLSFYRKITDYRSIGKELQRMKEDSECN